MVIVSVVCPTYNRRQWLPFMLFQYIHFDWPIEAKELIVLDDSDESNSDLFIGFEEYNIRYIHLLKKISIGQKRTQINELAKGDIIMCMDDDDIHHPQRIRHSVEQLLLNKVELVAATTLFVFYKSTGKIRLFGPYHETHGTHGTMAYTKKYAMTHKYDLTVSHAEERVFTENFSENLIQLNPLLTILCIAHESNTYDKSQTAVLQSSRETELTLRQFWP